jgi:hypothetical protein
MLEKPLSTVLVDGYYHEEVQPVLVTRMGLRTYERCYHELS